MEESSRGWESSYYHRSFTILHTSASQPSMYTFSQGNMSEIIGQAVQQVFMNNAKGFISTLDPLLKTCLKYLLSKLVKIRKIWKSSLTLPKVPVFSQKMTKFVNNLIHQAYVDNKSGASTSAPSLLPKSSVSIPTYTSQPTVK